MTHNATPAKPVYLFTDFGYDGPYVGQMKAVIHALAGAVPVIDLMHDAPRTRPDLASCLLPAVTQPLPPLGVVVAVVDPGVGGPRRPLVVETSRHLFVGPDNGLLARLPDIRLVTEIRAVPAGPSASFHGRDLFAPVAAALALGESVETSPVATESMVGRDVPVEPARVIYVDRYGNLMTDLDAEKLKKNSVLSLSGRRIGYARTFSDVPGGQLFWYLNSQGLVEIAANRASAATLLSLALGDKILLD